jgi:hypothetical protein
MSDQGNASRNARIDDLKEALAQANDDKNFWRAIAIRLFNKYVDPQAYVDPPALQENVGD